MNFLNPVKWIKLVINVWNLIKNAKIAWLAEKWAKNVQEIANDFTVLQNDITKRKKYTNSKDIELIAKKMKNYNLKTHKLWEEMKKDLKIKD